MGCLSVGPVLVVSTVDGDGVFWEKEHAVIFWFLGDDFASVKHGHVF